MHRGDCTPTAKVQQEEQHTLVMKQEMEMQQSARCRVLETGAVSSTHDLEGGPCFCARAGMGGSDPTAPQSDSGVEWVVCSILRAG